MILLQFLKYQLSLKSFFKFLAMSKKKKIKSKTKSKFKALLKEKKHQKICVSKC
jgi:hypothetical protein